jgi:hypothetical protein
VCLGVWTDYIRGPTGNANYRGNVPPAAPRDIEAPRVQRPPPVQHGTISSFWPPALHGASCAIRLVYYFTPLCWHLFFRHSGITDGQLHVYGKDDESLWMLATGFGMCPALREFDLNVSECFIDDETLPQLLPLLDAPRLNNLALSIGDNSVGPNLLVLAHDMCLAHTAAVLTTLSINLYGSSPELLTGSILIDLLITLFQREQWYHCSLGLAMPSLHELGVFCNCDHTRFRDIVWIHRKDLRRLIRFVRTGGVSKNLKKLLFTQACLPMRCACFCWVHGRQS